MTVVAQPMMHSQMCLAAVARLRHLSANVTGQREVEVGRLYVLLEVGALGRGFAALQTLELAAAGTTGQLGHPRVNVCNREEKKENMADDIKTSRARHATHFLASRL